jgi:hypothetical protein
MADQITQLFADQAQIAQIVVANNHSVQQGRLVAPLDPLQEYPFYASTRPLIGWSNVNWRWHVNGLLLPLSLREAGNSIGHARCTSNSATLLLITFGLPNASF